MHNNDECFVVGIGASAGGMEALFELFSNVDKNIPAAWVVVRHLKRDVPTVFDSLIKKYTDLDAVLIRGGERTEPGRIYIMPENRKVIIRGRTLYLRSRPSDEIINTAINTFFIDLALEVKDKAIGVILSGTGTDGVEGVKAIENNGGIVLVQDPATAIFGQLPKNTIHIDHPDYVMPPAEMPLLIEEYISRKIEQQQPGNF